MFEFGTRYDVVFEDGGEYQVLVHTRNKGKAQAAFDAWLEEQGATPKVGRPMQIGFSVDGTELQMEVHGLNVWVIHKKGPEREIQVLEPEPEPPPAAPEPPPATPEPPLAAPEPVLEVLGPVPAAPADQGDDWDAWGTEVIGAEPTPAPATPATPVYDDDDDW